MKRCLNANVNEKKKEKQHLRISNKNDQWPHLPKDIAGAMPPLIPTRTPPDQWSSLPDDLIVSISKRLNLKDLIRFSCVCSSWKLTSASLLPPKRNPWLVVPLGDASNKKNSVWGETTGFFSLSSGKVYKVETPQVADRRVCGSCRGGWLVTVHEKGEIQLLHPFSKRVINLPPITKLPSVVGSSLNWEKELEYTVLNDEREYTTVFGIGGTACQKSLPSKLIRDSYIYKASMSSSDPATAIVMLIQGDTKKLTFCRPGRDKKWRTIDGYYNARLADVAFYRGQFYAVRDFCHVFVVEGRGTRSPFIKSVIKSPHRLASDKYYLVESPGELLLVLKTLSRPTEGDFRVSYTTTRFRVFKLDFDGRSMMEVYNIGSDRAFFVGFNQSFSLETSDFPGCRGNCIYFTDDHVDRDEPFGGHDIGVFSLADGMVEKCFSNDSTAIKPPPVWFSTHMW